MYIWLKRTAVASTIVIFLVILMGSLVSQTGSGEGCGDTWPFCHGKLTPIGTIQSTIEYSHRAVSGVAGLLITVFSIWAWRVHRNKSDVAWLAFASIFFIFLQAGLGAGAVVWGQSDAILALHFGFSLTSFASVLLLTIRVYQYEERDKLYITHKPRSAWVGLAWAITLYSYIVVYLGAYVSHTGSGSSCTGWPVCSEGFTLNPMEPAGVVMIHRLAAAILFGGIVWLYVQARTLRNTRSDLYRGSFYALLFVVLQVVSGWILVTMNMHLFSLMLHNLIICFLFGALSFLCLQTYTGSSSNSLSEDDSLSGAASPIVR